MFRLLGVCCLVSVLVLAFSGGGRAADIADAVKRGPSIDYKGRTIVGSANRGIDNDTYFDVVKKAINMVETLPPDLRKQVGSIRLVFYDPPSPSRKKNDAYTNVVGVYTIGRNFNEPAPIIFYKDMKYSAPYEVAMSIVGNSLYAEDHLRMIDLRRQMAALRTAGDDGTSDKYKMLERENADLVAVVDKTDQNLLKISTCRGLKRNFDVLKAWNIRPDQRDRISQTMSNRDCWSVLPRT
jgi:hypothetical protein